MKGRSQKLKVIREIGYFTISMLLVALAYLISGTFFGIWIQDLKILGLLTASFYGIMGFYRILNYLARKAREED